jgi:hypothetical protein
MRRIALVVSIALFTLCSLGCDRDREVVPDNRKPLTDVIRAKAPVISQMEGVAAVYAGKNEKDHPVVCVMLMADVDSLKRKIPQVVDGYPVKIYIANQ